MMRRDFATADPNELLAAALGRLQEQDTGSLLVLKDGQVLGIVTPENIGEWVLLATAARNGRRGGWRSAATVKSAAAVVFLAAAAFLACGGSQRMTPSSGPPDERRTKT